MISSEWNSIRLRLGGESTAHSGFQFFADVARQVELFGIHVTLRQADSINGDLGRIFKNSIEVVDDIYDPNIPVFTLCHLFGHLIQFAQSTKYQQLTDCVSLPPPISLPDAFWDEFGSFENEAFRYGATLLASNDYATEDLMRRYAAYFEADFALFHQYVTTGRRSSREQYRRDIDHRYKARMSATIEPLAIPSIEVECLAGVEVTIF